MKEHKSASRNRRELLLFPRCSRIRRLHPFSETNSLGTLFGLRQGCPSLKAAAGRLANSRRYYVLPFLTRRTSLPEGDFASGRDYIRRVLFSRIYVATAYGFFLRGCIPFLASYGRILDVQRSCQSGEYHSKPHHRHGFRLPRSDPQASQRRRVVKKKNRN